MESKPVEQLPSLSGPFYPLSPLVQYTYKVRPTVGFIVLFFTFSFHPPILPHSLLFPSLYPSDQLIANYPPNPRTARFSSSTFLLLSSILPTPLGILRTASLQRMSSVNNSTMKMKARSLQVSGPMDVYEVVRMPPFIDIRISSLTSFSFSLLTPVTVAH